MSYQSPARRGTIRGDTSMAPGADPTARELIFLVSRVAAGFEDILKTNDSALSLSQWAILESLLHEGGSGRPSQIARKLGFSRQLIRQAAKKLMGLELVTADVPEEGRKAVALTLTKAGRATLDDIGDTTDELSDALNADRRGSGVNHAVRTLKLLSVAIAAKTLEEDEEGGDDAGA